MSYLYINKNNNLEKKKNFKHYKKNTLQSLYEVELFLRSLNKFSTSLRIYKKIK